MSIQSVFRLQLAGMWFFLFYYPYLTMARRFNRINAGNKPPRILAAERSLHTSQFNITLDSSEPPIPSTASVGQSTTTRWQRSLDMRLSWSHSDRYGLSQEEASAKACSSSRITEMPCRSPTHQWGRPLMPSPAHQWSRTADAEPHPSKKSSSNTRL